MTYSEFEDWLRTAIAGASPDQQRALAVDIMTRMTRQELLDEIDDPDAELSPEGWAAFSSARARLLSAGPDELESYIRIVDAGTLTDGNMDTCLLWPLLAIEHWADFLRHDEKALTALADIAIEEADFHDGGDLNDFLASPKLREESERIARLLGVDPPETRPRA